MTKDQLIAYCREWKVIYPADIQREFGLTESDAFDALQDLADTDAIIRRGNLEEIGFVLNDS